MKKLLPILLLFSVTICNAQFWSENFGTGCNSGTQVSAYVSSNGTWTVTTTGTNDASADIWFVSSKCNNTGTGICASGCSNSNNATLHVGNAAIPLASIPAGTPVTPAPRVKGAHQPPPIIRHRPHQSLLAAAGFCRKPATPRPLRTLPPPGSM